MRPKKQQDNNKRQETLPVSAPKTTFTSPLSSSDDSCTSHYLSLIAFYLSLNFLIATYRAYAQNDSTMTVFVFFAYVGYFALDYCSALFHRLPPDSFKRSFLRYVICCLGTAVLFGLAYEFSMFMYTPITLLAYAMAAASSGCLIYVYFILEDETDPNKETASFCSKC